MPMADPYLDSLWIDPSYFCELVFLIKKCQECTDTVVVRFLSKYEHVMGILLS